MLIVVFLPIFPQILSWTNSIDEQLVASNLLGDVKQDVVKNNNLITYLDGESIPDCSGRLLPVSDTDYQTNYTVNDTTFSVALTVCRSNKEAELGLYRTHLQLYLKGNSEKVSSDTYIYLNGDPK